MKLNLKVIVARIDTMKTHRYKRMTFLLYFLKKCHRFNCYHFMFYKGRLRQMSIFLRLGKKEIEHTEKEKNVLVSESDI